MVVTWNCWACSSSWEILEAFLSELSGQAHTQWVRLPSSVFVVVRALILLPLHRYRDVKERFLGGRGLYCCKRNGRPGPGTSAHFGSGLDHTGQNDRKVEKHSPRGVECAFAGLGRDSVASRSG